MNYRYLLCIILFGCGKKYDCPPEQIRPALSGYARSESDTVLITRFQRGTNLTQPIDTLLFQETSSNFYRVGDTTFITLYNSGQTLSGEYDIRITNPYDGHSVTISEMVHETRSQRKGIFSTDPQPCSSPIVSYRQNGQLINLPDRRSEMDNAVFLNR